MLTLPWRKTSSHGEKKKKREWFPLGGKAGNNKTHELYVIWRGGGGGGGGACWDLGQAMMTRPMTNTFPVMQGTVPGLLHWVYESTVDAEVMNWKAN